MIALGAVTGFAAAEDFARALMPHAPRSGVFIFDNEVRLRYAEGAALSDAGLDTGGLTGRLLPEMLSAAQWERIRPLFDRVLAGEELVEDLRSAADRPYRVHGWPVLGAGGDVEGGMLVGHHSAPLVEERLARVMAQQSAVAALGRLALSGEAGLPALIDRGIELVLDALPAASTSSVIQVLPDSEILLVRRESTGQTTDRRVPMPGSLAEAVLSSAEPVVLVDASTEGFSLPEALVAQGVREAVCAQICSEVGPFGVLSAFGPAPGAFSQEDMHFLTSMANVIAEAVRREEADAERHRRALHDGVTGLPNRLLLATRLREALDVAVRVELRVAVLFVDLDQFKVVNSSLGHHAGDQMLRAVAGRLGGAVRAGDTVARFGSDEFVIVATALEDERAAVRLAEGVMAALAAPIVVEDRLVHVRASVGVCMSSADPATESDSLIRAADAAMHRAKLRGGNRHEVFDPHTGDPAIDRLRIEQELRDAVVAGDMRLAFQPFMWLEGGVAYGVESLLRWEHPSRGLIGPGAFLDVAEQTGLLVGIGEWMLSEVCRHAARWRQPGFLATVNLSSSQLADPGIVEAVARALEESGLDPASLGLELTEQVLIRNESDALSTLTDLKALGVQLLLDDFGTGFSSLRHLKRFPIDTVKIDRSFVSGLDRVDSGDDAAIVSAVVGMSAAMGKQVIAEGIESHGQADALRRLGCELGQGYLLSRPVTAEEFERWLAESGRGAAKT